ncbi:MAG: hypothetical protein LBU17_10120 [Treponema sp.]|jgi:hypothetical protein|nr:hypothetical protein [Treponema sp.]
MKTLERTLPVPPDRRLHLDVEVPETWTGGSVRLVFFPVQEATAQTPKLPPKPEGAPPGCNFWQDRLRPGDDPFAWHKYIGAFKDVGLSVDEFLAEKHAENEREEAKFDAMFHRKQEQPE